MTGTVTKEMTLRRQLAKHGVKINEVRWILHTHHHIDHAGQDSQFSMRQTVVTNRRELEYSVSGIQGGQYPAEYVKHHIDRLHKPGAHAAARPRAVRPRRDRTRHRLRGGRRPHGRLDEHPRRDRRGNRLHLRRRRLRHPEPDDRPDPPGPRLRAAVDREPGHVEAPGARRDQEGARTAARSCCRSTTTRPASSTGGSSRDSSATPCRGRSSPSSTGRRARRGRWASVGRSSPFLPLRDGDGRASRPGSDRIGSAR